MGKKIEPTDAMIRDVESWGEILGVDDQDLLRYILNHPDARGLFTDDDARPWEPLAPGDPLHAGDEVRREHGGLTVTAVVGSVNEIGDPWTAEGELIGLLCYDTWYVRRAVQELPTASCTVIVPADGRARIEAKANIVWYANEAVLGPDNRWHAVWRTDSGLAISSVSPKEITPGTWKVDNR